MSLLESLFRILDEFKTDFFSYDVTVKVKAATPTPIILLLILSSHQAKIYCRDLIQLFCKTNLYRKRRPLKQ